MMGPRELTLDVLLDLDRQVRVVDPAARRKRTKPRDLCHRPRTINACEYRDAATLLADFRRTVDAVLRERGVIP